VIAVQQHPELENILAVLDLVARIPLGAVERRA
jgi:hypothetical protein